MRRADFHRSFYLLGTATLAVAMPLSHFLIGLASFLLFLNWIAEWNWSEKRSFLNRNRQGLWFAAFYLVYAIGLVHTTDWGEAGKEMLGKLPFLLSPIVVITSKPLNSNELRFVFSAFIIATLFACCWNFAYAQTHTLENFREMSRFIDHIRFSLCVVMSIVFCVHYMLHLPANKAIHRYIYLAISILLLAYLLYSQTLSGILIMMVITLCYIIHLIVNQKNNKLKWTLGGLLGLLLAVTVAYTLYITYDYFHVKDPAPDRTALTASGNPYTFEDNPMVENGYGIGNYVCEKELPEAWAMRSDTAYNELTAATLVRYLNSLGLRKDSAAVMQLSDEDIQNVENKKANIYYVRNASLRRALYETYFGFTLYEKYGAINESSLLERVELWRTTWGLVREHWLFGVGIGQQHKAVEQQLKLQNSPIADKKKNRGSHNQYLTFWLTAGIIPLLYFCFLLVFPFASMRKRVSFVYFAIILMLALSMLVEDTLNAQTGRMMFAVFVPLLLFNAETDKNSKVISN
ncbi:MAG: O-antigen ligase family protein [Bacteroidales bacterium]|nr:O-antigen ligase family protein [Bacteroidales bacterium]